MYNWTVDEKKFKKFPEKYLLWRLEQIINFGLGKERIKRSVLKKYWEKIDIDTTKRKYLKFLLWNKKF